MKITKQGEVMVVEMSKRDATLLVADILTARQAPSTMIARSALAIVMSKVENEAGWDDAKQLLTERCADSVGYAPDRLLVQVLEWLRSSKGSLEPDTISTAI